MIGVPYANRCDLGELRCAIKLGPTDVTRHDLPPQQGASKGVRESCAADDQDFYCVPAKTGKNQAIPAAAAALECVKTFLDQKACGLPRPRLF